jgi:hypothetical protein
MRLLVLGRWSPRAAVERTNSGGEFDPSKFTPHSFANCESAWTVLSGSNVDRGSQTE